MIPDTLPNPYYNNKVSFKATAPARILARATLGPEQDSQKGDLPQLSILIYLIFRGEWEVGTGVKARWK